MSQSGKRIEPKGVAAVFEGMDGVGERGAVVSYGAGAVEMGWFGEAVPAEVIVPGGVGEGSSATGA